MPNGGGVPSMQPALAGNPILAGDTDRLINILLKGPTAVLPPDREKFSNTMPPFNVLGDADLASVINYLRANFAPAAPKVTPGQVAAQRAKL
jgi:mono/diheme cytochrome c family protein